MGKLTAPEPLGGHHDLSSFDCGEPRLNEWLRSHAQRNEASGSSRTFVVCQGEAVVGYYTLATGGITHIEATSRVRRNAPAPIPVLILGRLAVDATHQGKGIGEGLLRDALLRSLAVSESVGVRAVLVHALTNDAKNFYIKHGFAESPLDNLTLMLSISNIKSAIANE